MSKPAENESCCEYHYPVKIVCGVAPSKGEFSNIVAKGQYFTAVNVYNPSSKETVVFRRKLVIALPGAQQGPVSEYVETKLEPCRALEIDCPDIFKQAPEKTKFIKGFLAIQSRWPLEIVAVYTAGDKCCESVVAFHTERVPHVKYPVCDDLDLSLNSGVADWRAIQVPDGPANLDIPATEVPSSTKPSIWLDIPGAEWISSGEFLNGTYRFKFCFCLCDGFENARMAFDVRTDNAGKIFFNRATNPSAIGATAPTSWKDPETHIEVTDQSLFVEGENCLEVELVNTGGPTGFTLAGNLTAKRAKCPC